MSGDFGDFDRPADPRLVAQVQALAARVAALETRIGADEATETARNNVNAGTRADATAIGAEIDALRHEVKS